MARPESWTWSTGACGALFVAAPFAFFVPKRSVGSCASPQVLDVNRRDQWNCCGPWLSLPEIRVFGSPPLAMAFLFLQYFLSLPFFILFPPLKISAETALAVSAPGKEPPPCDHRHKEAVRVGGSQWIGSKPKASERSPVREVAVVQ